MTSPIVLPDSDNLKRCCRCKTLKPLSAFSRNAAHTDGYQSECKPCRLELNRAYLARRTKKNHQRGPVIIVTEKRCSGCKQIKPSSEFNRDSSRNDGLSAECRECRLQRVHTYRSANQDSIRNQQRAYRQSTKGRDIERMKRHNRRVREGSDQLSASEMQEIRLAQTDKSGRLICWRCGKPIYGNPHLDHWTPLAKGGANSAGNLHYMHAKCNLTKSTKHPFELGRLL